MIWLPCNYLSSIWFQMPVKGESNKVKGKKKEKKTDLFSWIHFIIKKYEKHMKYIFLKKINKWFIQWNWLWKSQFNNYSQMVGFKCFKSNDTTPMRFLAWYLFQSVCVCLNKIKIEYWLSPYFTIMTWM